MSDVEGSTRLWETKADAMREAVKDLDTLVLDAVQAHHGTLLKERGEGDSHFAVFAHPTHALQAAVQIQRLLAGHEWPTGTPLVARMAIHSARAHPTGADYYGPDVNRCARIRGAGHGGQILISQTTREGLDATSDAWTLEDLGLHRLLDLSEPQRIYQVQAPGLKEGFAPLKSLNAVKHNLPVELTSFVGRGKELAELRDLVTKSRLLTILGPGGAGKTRTALQLVAESVDKVQGGVWFVDLSPLQDPSMIAQKVVEDLYVRSGADEPEQAIAAHFQGQNSLLLLDNCEHVAREAAAFTAKLLKECPDLYIVATSREPLGVSGERAYRLPPLSLAADRAGTLDDISGLDAVRLLLERARARGHEDVLTQSKPAVILELCRKLDGIPLAIEQAAANLGVLTPETMLARLDEHLSVLHIDDEGVATRHRTLTAAIDWSYDALSDQERRLFCDLSVFVGGWTLAAAEAICEIPNVLDLMHSLVSKSLVWPEVTQAGERRFRFLETIREYAIQKRGPLSSELAERHLSYFFHLTELAEQAGLDADHGRWTRALDADHANIIESLKRAIASKDNAVEGLALANNMYRYWLRRGYLREAGNWFQRAIDAAPTAPPDLRGNALIGLGVFAWYQGKLGPAQAAMEASLRLWKEIGNDSKIGATLNNLAILALEREQLEEARALLGESIAVFEKAGDDARLASALQNVGQMEGDRGAYDSAISLTERALRIQRRLDNRESLATLISNLLGFYAETTGLQDRLNLIEESIEIAKEIGSPDITSSVLDVVAFSAMEYSKFQLAANLIGASERLAESLGIQLAHYTQTFRQNLAERVQEKMGRQAFREGEAAGAALNAEQALGIADEFIRGL
jgi:predicted ATPase/class 3 adenylate cyclase